MPFLPPQARQAHGRQLSDLRCRPRLPVPMLVLHHHQRAGTQVALPLAGRRRAHRPRRTGAQGIHRFFITDDNFARNKDWEADLRPASSSCASEHGIQLSSDDPGRYALPQDPELHRKGGKRRRHARVHRHGERQSRQRCMAAKKRQNKITEYRKHAAGVEGRRRRHLCGLHPRLPDRHAGDRSGATSRSSSASLPIDMLEFFCLTPLPGSEDHQMLLSEGHRDGSRHEQIRPRARRDRPSADEQGEWEAVYRAAWEPTTRAQHMETILRRAAATGVQPRTVARHAVALRAVHQMGEHPSAAGRHLPPEISPRPPPNFAARTGVALLPAVRLGISRGRPSRSQALRFICSD